MISLVCCFINFNIRDLVSEKILYQTRNALSNFLEYKNIIYEKPDLKGEK